MALSANTVISHANRKSRSASLRGRLMTFFALARQRRQLAALDQHILDDIGITRAQADAETQKSAWDVPQHWHY